MKMRRGNLVMASLAVPSVTALSLANFQQITSGTIPVACQLTYNSRIPSCNKSDFENGCSEICQAGLKFLASGVTAGCSNVIASSSTLLGIVMNGGIIQALCPAITVSTSQTSTSAPRTTISPVIVSSSSIAVSTTSEAIPTNSAGVTAGISSTSSALPATTSSDEVSETPSPSERSSTLNPPSSTIVSSPSSSAPSTVSPVSSSVVATSGSVISTASSASAGPGNLDSVSTSTSAAPAAKSTAPAGKGTGGGSPFDIQSGANRAAGNSAFYALIISVLASMLLGR